MSQTRRLAAILAADVVGYSRLIGADEEGTLNRLKSIRAEVVDPSIAQYRGRIVKTTRDGLLVEFVSVIDALKCATEIQNAMIERNAGIAADKRIEFRIGVHQGDIVVEDGDIFGDGVNVAARLEGLAQPGGICVSARVQEDAAGKLDLTFEDLGEQNLKNIARSVRVYRVRPTAIERTRSSFKIKPILAPPDKPSIAVLPFQNMSGDPEQEYFADGMVEEIITALSRIRWLFVIARNSSFTYKGQSVDVKQVGRELGVRYVLEGSVRKAGQRVRITAQLIDATTSTHLWADRFNGSLEDVFELQDNVALSVAGVIEPTLQAAEIRRSSERPTSDLTAYDLYLRALPHVTAREKERLEYAFDLLRQVVERDPNYGPALAQTAYYHYQLDLHGWADNSEQNRRESIDLARQALRCAPDDPEVLVHAAHVLGYFDEDIDVAIALIDRALVLNPSYASGWYWSGVIRNWVGQPDLALEHFATFLRLSPRERFPFYLGAIGIALFFTRQFDDAAAKLRESLQRFPNLGVTYRFLAASYAHMGRLSEAREVAEHMRTLNLNVLEGGTRYRSREYRDLYLSGLRLAAGEVDNP
jgi:TolB-like protein/class 3 adenylate cyclase